MIIIQDNWEHISKTWGSGFLITRFVSAIVSPVCLSLPSSLLLLIPQVSIFVRCISIANVIQNAKSNITSY
jgi:hypothetical protein